MPENPTPSRWFQAPSIFPTQHPPTLFHNRWLQIEKRNLLFCLNSHCVSGVVLKELGQKVKTLAQRARSWGEGNPFHIRNNFCPFKFWCCSLLSVEETFLYLNFSSLLITQRNLAPTSMENVHRRGSLPKKSEESEKIGPQKKSTVDSCSHVKAPPPPPLSKGIVPR